MDTITNSDRPISILEVPAGWLILAPHLNRLIALAARAPASPKDWEGHNGIWTATATAVGEKEGTETLRITASYLGPSFQSCRITFTLQSCHITNKAETVRLEIYSPMPDDIDDDGPAMIENVIALTKTALHAHATLPRRQDEINNQGDDATPWLIAAAVLAGKFGDPIEVSLPSPCTGVSASGLQGEDIIIPPNEQAMFNAAAPMALRVSVEAPRQSITTTIRFQPVNAILDDGRIDIGNTVSTLRAISFCAAAGAFL